MAKSKFTNLKGIRLYNALLKELGELNKANPKTARLSARERRAIVTNELFPKFKDKAKLTQAEVIKEVKRVVRGLPPAEICNPLYLNKSLLADIAWFDIDNHIKMVLPECLDIRVNGGSFGITKIFNTSSYKYNQKSVLEIVDNIRTEVDNTSGAASFFGVIKVKPNRKDDGDGKNYFVDFVLFLDDQPQGDDTPTKYKLPSKAKKKKEAVSKVLGKKFKVLLREKAKKARIRRKQQEIQRLKKPEEAKKLKKQTLQNLEFLYLSGAISKEQYNEIKKGLK